MANAPDPGLRLSHISLTARDGQSLAAFYTSVFGFNELRPPRRLTGRAVYRGNGLPGVDITARWLCLPDAPMPFLEIMEYAQLAERDLPLVNEPGFGHLALRVHDLRMTLQKVLSSGGTMQGEVSNFGSTGLPHLVVYIRDPEGNLLELEQPSR